MKELSLDQEIELFDSEFPKGSLSVRIMNSLWNHNIFTRKQAIAALQSNNMKNFRNLGKKGKKDLRVFLDLAIENKPLCELICPCCNNPIKIIIQGYKLPA